VVFRFALKIVSADNLKFKKYLTTNSAPKHRKRTEWSYSAFTRRCRSSKAKFFLAEPELITKKNLTRSTTYKICEDEKHHGKL
jgi:hypothetical protein